MAEVTYQVVRKPIEERLLDAACIYWDVNRQYFSKRTVKTERKCVYRSRIVQYLIHQNTIYSYAEIATKFGFLSTSRIQDGIEEIEARKHIYKQVNEDLNQISYLADKLDASVITSSIKLENKQINNASIHSNSI